jgi:hypothetical protein
MSVCLSVCVFVGMFVCRPVCICLPVSVSVCIKFLLLRIFLACHRLQQFRWSPLSGKYLYEFSNKFETILIEYSGAGGKMIDDTKSETKESRDTVPLNILTIELLFCCKKYVD